MATHFPSFHTALDAYHNVCSLPPEIDGLEEAKVNLIAELIRVTADLIKVECAQTQAIETKQVFEHILQLFFVFFVFFVCCA